VCKGAEIQVNCIPLLVGLSLWVKLMVTYNSTILKKRKKQTASKTLDSIHPSDSLFQPFDLKQIFSDDCGRPDQCLPTLSTNGHSVT
jgi:hypothetical protein